MWWDVEPTISSTAMATRASSTSSGEVAGGVLAICRPLVEELVHPIAAVAPFQKASVYSIQASFERELRRSVWSFTSADIFPSRVLNSGGSGLIPVASRKSEGESRITRAGRFGVRGSRARRFGILAYLGAYSLARLAFFRGVSVMIDLGLLLQVFDVREVGKLGDDPHCLSIEDL